MDEKYEIKGYYDKDLRGLANSTATNSFDEAVDAVHAYCSDGSFVKIVNNETGQQKTYDPDTWMEAIDMGDIPEDIKELA